MSIVIITNWYSSDVCGHILLFIFLFLHLSLTVLTSIVMDEMKRHIHIYGGRKGQQ
jgi:hypothetical protein